METPQVSKPEEKPKYENKNLKIAAMIVGGLLLVLIIFAAGVGVGLKKARFSFRWGENYERNFMGPRPSFGDPGFMDGMMRSFEGRDFRNPHGLSGTIISVSNNNLIIKDNDGKENTVGVTDKTIIKKAPLDNLKLSDLQIDDRVVVMGRPEDSGVVDAILIRVFEK
jgi:hypothetical protein